jgi:hypothetical protein
MFLKNIIFGSVITASHSKRTFLQIRDGEVGADDIDIIKRPTLAPPPPYHYPQESCVLKMVINGLTKL